MKKSFKLENLGCANCAAKMEADINKLGAVNKATVSFMTSRLTIDAATDDLSPILDEAQKIVTKYESDCTIKR